MLTRIATGLVLAPLLIWLILAGPLWAIAVVVAVAAALAAGELVGMFAVCSGRDRALAMVLSGAIAGAPLAGGLLPHAVLMVAVAVVMATVLRSLDDLEAGARRSALLVLALAYVGGMGAAMVSIGLHASELPAAHEPVIAGLAFGRGALITMFAIVFGGDTGAYFAGRALGRHKLNELVSPKKTWEGTVGGLLASMAFGWLGHRLLVPALPAAHAIGLGLCCGAFGQIGDLSESLFKRATGTKDSGRLLPGHGGMLDRIDGVLFAAPVFYLYLLLVH